MAGRAIGETGTAAQRNAFTTLAAEAGRQVGCSILFVPSMCARIRAAIVAETRAGIREAELTRNARGRLVGWGFMWAVA